MVSDSDRHEEVSGETLAAVRGYVLMLDAGPDPPVPVTIHVETAMPSLLESFGQSFTPDTLAKLGASVGLDPNLVTKGLGAVGPLLTGAMAGQTATPQGLDGLMKLIPQDGGAGLSNLAGLLHGGAPTEALSGLFGGSGLGAAGRTLDQKLGFKASSLLAMAAPVVLGLVSKMRSEQKLDTAGIAKTLQDEQKTFLASGNENATLVNTVLAASNEANATRACYTDAQWQAIRLGPMAAAQVVMIASPSGPIGTIKEAGAVARAVDEVRNAAPPASLLGIAFEENFTMEELNSLGGRKATKEQLLSAIKEAVATVASQGTEDAISYRRFLIVVATKVAEASKEGGFLGVGGTLVSAEEKVALGEVGVAVGV